ncbi:MAG: hypothetical protein WDA09_06880 [Bacteriovoracaceae bacterium]
MRSYVYYSMLSMSGAYGMNHYGIDVSEGLEVHPETATTEEVRPAPVQRKKRKSLILKGTAYLLTIFLRGR